MHTNLAAEKVLLLRPFTDSTIGNSPPSSLMYLSAYLKFRGANVVLLDNSVESRSLGDFVQENKHIKAIIDNIAEINPTVVGMTLFSRELAKISVLCKLIKQVLPSVRIILGGPHPTAMPQETLEQIPTCDIVVRGEGELVLDDIFTSLSQGKDLRSVPGISIRQDGEVIHNANAGIITNLDSLPFPDRESLIDNYQSRKYSSFLYGSPSDILLTSRGCPFHCGFCFKVCNKYRARSSENVLAEIDWVVTHVHPQSIQIMDDSFTINRQRCIAILDGLIERGYHCRFKVRSRVNVIDEDLLRKMKKAGVDTIVYGLESGSQTMLNAFNKRTKVEENIRACQLARRAGIACLGDMILFYPGENRQTLKETAGFIRKAKPTAVKFYVLTPLPQTKVYNEAKEKGTLQGGWEIGDERPWVKLNDFNGVAEMEKIAKSMYLKTILTPHRIIWILKSYGIAILRNPLLAARMIVYNFIKKNRY